MPPIRKSGRTRWYAAICAPIVVYYFMPGHRRMPVYFDILSIHTSSVYLLSYLYNNRQPGFDFDLSHD
ncbi:MAG TPA: hypothetical protein PLD24_03460, partial [Macellibacteroides fermentans]|nr:hypothetical protein [Macellibacteroides fermentans]